MWDRFSVGEMARRWALARDLMRRRDLACLLVFGNSGVNRHNQANVFWLTNHLDLHHNYLVASLDEAIEPALYVGLTNHVPNARQVSDVPIIEWGGYNPAEAVAARLQAVGLGGARIGIVGINHKFGACLKTGGTHEAQAVSRDVMRMESWGRSSPRTVASTAA
ncbi:MAG: hypothetical protein QME77_09115 [bacterium]|nr:hypothetical protein [bacterium]